MINYQLLQEMLTEMNSNYKHESHDEIEGGFRVNYSYRYDGDVERTYKTMNITIVEIIDFLYSKIINIHNK